MYQVSSRKFLFHSQGEARSIGEVCWASPGPQKRRPVRKSECVENPPYCNLWFVFLGNWGLNGTNYFFFFPPSFFIPWKSIKSIEGFPVNKQSFIQILCASTPFPNAGACGARCRHPSDPWFEGSASDFTEKKWVISAGTKDGDICGWYIPIWEYLWLMSGMGIYQQRNGDICGWCLDATFFITGICWMFDTTQLLLGEDCPSTAVWGQVASTLHRQEDGC